MADIHYQAQCKEQGSQIRKVGCIVDVKVVGIAVDGAVGYSI